MKNKVIYDRIKKLLAAGTAYIQEAAGEIAKLYFEQQISAQEIARNIDRSSRWVYDMARVGRGELLLEVAMAPALPFRSLSRCPVETQKKYFKEPVEVLVTTVRGPDKLLVEVQNLTRDQINQVFTADRVRTVGEQRAYIASVDRRTKAQAQGEDLRQRFVRRGRKVIVVQAFSRLSMPDLYRMKTLLDN